MAKGKKGRLREKVLEEKEEREEGSCDLTIVSFTDVHPKPNDDKSDEEFYMPVRPDCPVSHGIKTLAVLKNAN